MNDFINQLLFITGITLQMFTGLKFEKVSVNRSDVQIPTEYKYNRSLAKGRWKSK